REYLRKFTGMVKETLGSKLSAGCNVFRKGWVLAEFCRPNIPDKLAELIIARSTRQNLQGFLKA
ncbi:MAG: hypothetical protein DRO46_01575, partial [Candidatus Hecatellales archaeon]